MLSIQIQSKERSSQLTPNLLPCRVDYSGPADVSNRYWRPIKGADDSHISYFRGRKLCAKTINVPEGYKGVALERTAKLIPHTSNIPPDSDEGDDDLEPEIKHDTKIMQEVACFDKIAVWSHEALPSDDDPFAKGIAEWMAFSNAMNAPGTPS